MNEPTQNVETDPGGTVTTEPGASYNQNQILIKRQLHHEYNIGTFAINMFIIITKLIIYRKRPEGLSINIYYILSSMQNEMLVDEYDCEVIQFFGVYVDILHNKQ